MAGERLLFHIMIFCHCQWQQIALCRRPLHLPFHVILLQYRCRNQLALTSTPPHHSNYILPQTLISSSADIIITRNCLCLLQNITHSRAAFSISASEGTMVLRYQARTLLRLAVTSVSKISLKFLILCIVVLTSLPVTHYCYFRTVFIVVTIMVVTTVTKRHQKHSDLKVQSSFGLDVHSDWTSCYKQTSCVSVDVCDRMIILMPTF